MVSPTSRVMIPRRNVIQDCQVLKLSRQSLIL